MSETQSLLKIRPLETIKSNTKWRGSIDGNHYRLIVGPYECCIPISRTGSDKRGEYAEVMPCDERREDGTRLLVEPEVDELWPDGGLVCCRVSLVRLAAVFVNAEAHLRNLGIDPASVNVIAPGPFDTLFAVLFHAQGIPNEWLSPVTQPPSQTIQ
jgi:hypothetical protein